MKRKVYSKADLLRIKQSPLSQQRPANLPTLEGVIKPEEKKIRFFNTPISCRPQKALRRSDRDQDPDSAIGCAVSYG